MDDRDRIIAWIARRECQRIAGKVLRGLQRITKGMQSGDDSGLANLWDEVCVQVQGQESGMWDYYWEMMRDMIEKQVDTLSAELTEAIWLQTEEGSDWASDRDSDVESEHDRRVEVAARVKTMEEALSLLLEMARQADIDPGPFVQPLYEDLREAKSELEESKGAQERGDNEEYDGYVSEDLANYILNEFLVKLAADYNNRRIQRYLDTGREFD